MVYLIELNNYFNDILEEIELIKNDNKSEKDYNIVKNLINKYKNSINDLSRHYYEADSQKSDFNIYPKEERISV